MLRPATEFHSAEEIMGKQNEHMLASMNVARQCITRLIALGFTVLAVRVRHREPIVIVQHDARCDQLKGAAAAVAIGPHGREQMMTASFWGCSVQWSTGN